MAETTTNELLRGQRRAAHADGMASDEVGR
jgi:hypothetical protein